MIEKELDRILMKNLAPPLISQFWCAWQKNL